MNLKLKEHKNPFSTKTHFKLFVVKAIDDLDHDWIIDHDGTVITITRTEDRNVKRVKDYTERKELGLCVRCNKTALDGKKMCAKHQAMYRKS